MRGLLLRWAILTAAIAAASSLIGGVEVTGGFWGYVWVAAILGLVNALVRPILVILTLPITILTLGLFLVIVNAASLAIVDWLSRSLTIEDFWTTILAALVISIVSWGLQILIGDDRGLR